MKNKIIKRIEKELNHKGIVKDLANLQPSDLQSLLLYVYSALLQNKTLGFIKTQNQRFIKPSKVSPKKILEFDSLAYSILPEQFSALELSPVAPLGINKLLTNINQKTVMTTIRNLEVVADPTTFLAFFCAIERQKILKNKPKSKEAIHLSTSHRLTRTQKFSNKAFSPHFRIFALSSAGKDEGNELFETKNMKIHLNFYLKLLNQLATLKYQANDITVKISNLVITENIIKHYNLERDKILKHTQDSDFSLWQLIKNKNSGPYLKQIDIDLLKQQFPFLQYKELIKLQVIEKNVLRPLRKKFPKVKFIFDFQRIAGLGYYTDLGFKITAKNNEKQELPLVDGGMSDWTQKLISSAKERLLSGGIGTELFCQRFQK